MLNYFLQVQEDGTTKIKCLSLDGRTVLTEATVHLEEALDMISRDHAGQSEQTEHRQAA